MIIKTAAENIAAVSQILADRKCNFQFKYNPGNTPEFIIQSNTLDTFFDITRSIGWNRIHTDDVIKF